MTQPWLRALVLVTGSLTMGASSRAEDEFALLRAGDEEEIRDELLPIVDALPDAASIRTPFERFLAGDTGVGPALVALTAHANEDVARYAALSAGWIGGSSVTQGLRGRFLDEQRSLVKGSLLSGLARTRDAGTAALAVTALSDSDEVVQMAGIGTLLLIGQNSDAQALLNYLDSPGRLWPPESTFEVLEKLGNPPGSTGVTDRLATEANSKANEWDTREAAAEALRRMGRSDLAIDVLNRVDAALTYDNMLYARAEIRLLAEGKRLTIRSQLDVEALLTEVVTDPIDRRLDLWGRPLRVKYLSPAAFAVVSDGPDRTPGTTDDASTTEPWASYNQRMFKGLFR